MMEITTQAVNNNTIINIFNTIECGTTLCTEDMCTEIEIDVSYMKKWMWYRY